MAFDLSRFRKRTDTALISYFALQTLVGVIALLLPFVLMSGKVALGSPGIESSISAYYHTSMRDWFVGSLCAIGVFMSSYRGKEDFHHIFSIVAALCAVGVALFPTTRTGEEATWVGVVHFSCAAVLFALLAFFSLVVFPSVSRKLGWFHQACGGVIVACIAIGLLAAAAASDWLKNGDLLFWLEAIAVVFFALSWLAKGTGGLLKQRERRKAAPNVAAAMPIAEEEEAAA